MRSRRNISQLGAFVVVAFFVFGSARAQEKQDIEYGEKAELRGAKTIFINSGTNLTFRKNAIEMLKKELPGITVVDKRPGADVLLQVEIEGSDRGHGQARLLVIVPTSTPNATRIVAKYEDAKSSIFTFKLSTVLMGRFIRDYREANQPVR
jgi:hypothetical protein